MRILCQKFFPAETKHIVDASMEMPRAIGEGGSDSSEEIISEEEEEEEEEEES